MYKPTVETKAAPAICHLSTTQRKRRPALIPNLDNFSPADTQDLARSRGIQIPPLVPAACQAMAEKTNVSSMKKPNWRRALLVKTESESPKNDISTRDDEAQVESPRSDRRFLQRLKIPLVSSRGNHNGTREQESVRYDAPQISQLRLGCGRSARRGETRGGRGLSSPVRYSHRPLIPFCLPLASR